MKKFEKIMNELDSYEEKILPKISSSQVMTIDTVSERGKTPVFQVNIAKMSAENAK